MLTLLDGKFTPVLKTGLVKKMGAFSPVTESGRIVSDGIMFSVYEELTSHIVAHLAFSNFNKQLKKIPFLKNFFYKEFGGQSLILTIT